MFFTFYKDSNLYNIVLKKYIVKNYIYILKGILSELKLQRSPFMVKNGKTVIF